MVITECTEHNEVVDIEFPIYMKSEYNDSEVEDYSHVLYTRVAEDDTFVSISIDTYGGKSEYSINTGSYKYIGMRRDEVLGLGKYASNEDEFSKAAQRCLDPLMSVKMFTIQ